MPLSVDGDNDAEILTCRNSLQLRKVWGVFFEQQIRVRHAGGGAWTDGRSARELGKFQGLERAVAGKIIS